MIYVKHLITFGLVLLAAPWLGRFLVQKYLDHFRLARLPLTWFFVVSSLVAAVAVPLLAQAWFDYLRGHTEWTDLQVRLIALGVSGGIYGALLGAQPYMRWGLAVFLGAGMGATCARLYTLWTPAPWQPLVYALLLAGIPLCTIQAPSPSRQRRLGGSRKLFPFSGLWH